MENPGNNQALAATFAFGIVVIAALGTASLYLRGGASSLSQDGPRLALVVYLASSFLWALTGFIATLVATNAASVCQVAVAFASAFDQLARILLEQFLFWGMKSDVQVSFGVLFPQAIIILRFVLGGVYVGVQRPQFKPVCVGTTLVLPLGIAVLVADAFIVLMLFVRASSVGTFRDVSEKAPGWPRSRGLLLITLGLVVWIALSVPTILGKESFDLAVRTVLPAVGLLVAIVLVALFNRSLTTKYDTNASPYPPTPDAPPAFSTTRDLPTRDLQRRDISTINTSYSPRPYASVRTAPASSRGQGRDISSSREGRGGLPIISQPSPGQVQVGVGALPVKGQRFPPMRAQTAAATPQSSDTQPVRKATIKGGKLVISNPVVSAEIEPGPWQRITTVDLATAARNEKERRDRNPHPLLFVSPKTMSPEGMQNQPQNLERKDVGNPYSPAADSRQLFQPIAERSPTAAAPSAQFSPGRDDVRRRSPRQVSRAVGPDFPPAVPSKNVKAPDIDVSGTSTATVPLVPPPRSPLRPAPKPQTPGGSRRQGGSTPSPRRSRSGTRTFTDPNPPPRIPVQPPGPSKPTIPLAASPRQSVELLVPPIPPLYPRESPPPWYKSSGSQRHTRQPLAGLARNGSVRADIRPSRQKPKSPPPGDQTRAAKTPVQLRQNNGIPSNPRARIMRATPKTRGGPGEQTVTFVNGIEYDDPSAMKGIMDQALGNTAKGSPDFDESSRVSVVHRPRPISRRSPMEYSPLKGSSKMHRDSRNRLLESTEAKPSIVPQSAGILQPATYSETGAGPTQISSPAPGASRNLRRRSSLPDISVLPSQSLPTPQALPTMSAREVTPGASTAETPRLGTGNLLYAPGSRSRQSKFAPTLSVHTAVSPLEEPQSGLYESPSGNRSSNEGARRRSSPVLPTEDQQDCLIPEDTEVQENEFINGARLNSAGTIRPPASASNAQDSKEAEASAVTFNSRMRPDRSTYRFVDSPLTMDEDDGKETVIVMLDQSAEYRTKTQASAREPNRDSWHRCVGEDCPSFSDRKSMARTRNVPRPPPLQLNKPTRLRKVVAAEPLCLEPPQHALDMLQEQLKKFEEPREEAREQQRMTRLADLEMEMGMQENRWQQMRQDYFQTPTSTSVSSPNANSANGSLEHSPVVKVGAGAPGSEALADRTSRLDPGDARDARESGFCSPYSAVTATAERVQIGRLNVAEWPLVNGAEVPFEGLGPGLSVDDRTMPRASSPSPPQSDDSGNRGQTHGKSGFGNDSNVETGSELRRPGSSSLPTPSPRPTEPAIDAANQSSELAKLPAASARPVSPEPLVIESLCQWKTPRSPSTPQEQQQQPATRPRALRRPRRSKRISTLPDIVEDPVPLLNKRGTLGIFQFPWGERSDTATVPLQRQIPMGMGMMGMPGNVMPGPPMCPSLEAQVCTQRSQDYPSSFFDDYDDGDNFVDTSDDDDSFDEETLWEIASLLRSDNVPSRESLLSAKGSGGVESSSMVEDYRAGSPLPEDEGEPMFEASPVAFDRDSSSPTLPSPAVLWVDQTGYVSVMWLPQPDEKVWRANVASASETVRAPLRSAAPATIASTALWSATPREASSHPTIPAEQSIATLWAPNPVEEPQVGDSPEEEPHPVAKALPSPVTVNFMWSPPEAFEMSPVGLCRPDGDWTKYLVPGYAIRRTKPPVTTALATIESTLLWTPNSAEQPEVTAVSELEAQPEPVDKAEPTTAYSPWSPPKPIVVVSHGLPQPVPTVWEKYLIPKSEAPRLAPRVAKVESTSLWTPNPAELPQVTALPEQETQPEPFNKAVSGTTLSLWSPPKLVEVISCGLAHPVPTAGAREGTTLWTPTVAAHVEAEVNEAAALGTRPTPMSLWSPPARHACARDWVSPSSIRPSTPEGVSSASSSDSPFSDTSSVYSSITGHSTVGSMFTGCPEDDASRHNRHPDWDAGLREAARPSRPARDLASAADYDAALEDAIRATGFEAARPRPPRQPASDADWDSALEDAIGASGFDPAMPAARRDSIAAEPSQGCSL
ncbi:Uncharacterized protein TPAR_05362 [Tolypocladium paradoxum]|uniref:Uncharacterized protein n=1 Tax=Tolypocladium paradoxum TaxID=94208 RepID=A0A2S4KW64_9HYPO|nr:Uncharacterized protein TPAR_05362 [Tolypocladium paradoxum]